MPIPYNIDFGLRNAVLLQLAQDVVAAGGTVVGISQGAGETWPNWIVFLNRISAAVNALGASPPLPIYTSLDYSAFGSVVKNIVNVALVTPPTNLTPPTCTVVTGGTVAGTSVLTCTLGTWTGSPTLTRQWLSNGTVLPGQTGATYASQPADSGNSISCGVVATNSSGSTPITSNSIALT